MRRRTPEPSSAIGSYGTRWRTVPSGRELPPGFCPFCSDPATAGRPRPGRSLTGRCTVVWRSSRPWSRRALPHWTGRRTPLPASWRRPPFRRSPPPGPAPWSSSSTMWGGGFTWWTPGTIWRRTDAPGPTTPLPPVFRSRWRPTGIICAPPFSTL